MKGLKIAALSALVLMAGMAVPAAAQQRFNAYATTNVNQRYGPSTGYPVMQVIPAGALVRVRGCLTGLNWCETRFLGQAGWVKGTYLEILWQGRRRPFIRWGGTIGIPIIPPWYRPWPGGPPGAGCGYFGAPPCPPGGWHPGKPGHGPGGGSGCHFVPGAGLVCH